MAVAPSPATQAIWTKLQGYETWPTFPENTTPKASASHMKMFVVARYNDVVATAMKSKMPLPLPDGSIIVKDNLAKADDKAPMAVTVMAKQNGAWYWIEAMPNGMVLLDPSKKPLEGTDVAMCTTCHDAKTNDGVMTHAF